jgi:hypothetical protein
MQCIFMNVIISYYIFQMPIDFVFLYHRHYYCRSSLWVAWRISYEKGNPLPFESTWVHLPFFGKFHVARHLSFLCCVFFSFLSVSCAKFYLCLLILHSGLILRIYLKICYFLIFCFRCFFPHISYLS